MGAISMYRGNLHRAGDDAARHWQVPPPTLSASRFRRLLRSRSLAVSRLAGAPRVNSPSPSLHDALQQQLQEEGHDVQQQEVEEEMQDEQLKTLNSMLLKEAVERRGQVAALTARLEETSADGDALDAAERAVARAALAAPLRAAAEEASALRARLAAVQDSLRLAESKAALEAGAKDEAHAGLKAAAGEKARFLKLLQVKEAEVASISNKVSSLAAVMAELEGNNSVLLSQNGELMKELEETKEAVRVILSQKAEVEGSFQGFKEKMGAYRVEMEGKLRAKVEDVEMDDAGEVVVGGGDASGNGDPEEGQGESEGFDPNPEMLKQILNAEEEIKMRGAQASLRAAMPQPSENAADGSFVPRQVPRMTVDVNFSEFAGDSDVCAPAAANEVEQRWCYACGISTEVLLLRAC